MAIYLPSEAQTVAFLSKWADHESGCLLWTAAVHKEHGYGLYSWWDSEVGHSRTRRAHRLMWEITQGPIPSELQVLHDCDVRLCGRHLYLGTHQRNMEDRQRRGRQAQGMRVNTAKLTENQVREIRSRTGTNVALALEYGVSNVMISYIRSGKNWKGLI